MPRHKRSGGQRGGGGSKRPNAWGATSAPAPAPVPAATSTRTAAVAAPAARASGGGASASGIGGNVLQTWVAKRLEHIVTIPDLELDVIAQYLVTFTTANEVVDFLEPYAGKSAATSTFAREFVARKNAKQALSGMQRVQKVGGSDELAEFMGTAAPAPAPAPAPSPSKPKQQRVNEPWVELTKAEKNRLAAEKRRQQREAVAAPAPDIVAARVTRGRRAEPAPGTLCNCAATVHGLLTNCLHCGKIICNMEAGKLCTFCSHPLEGVGPMSKKAIATRRSEAKVAGRRFEEAHGGVSFEEAEAQQAESMRRALAHKEKLLEFDRTSAARSRVYDDQADYFQDASSTWLSKRERSRARAKEAERHTAMHTRDHTVRVTMDLVGRRVVAVDKSGAELADLSKGVELDAPSAVGAFTNDTLSGRAREIYSALTHEYDQRSRAARQKVPESADGPLTVSRRLQHDDPLEEVAAAQAQDTRPSLDRFSTAVAAGTAVGGSAATGAATPLPGAPHDEFWDFEGQRDAGAVGAVLNVSALGALGDVPTPGHAAAGGGAGGGAGAASPATGAATALVAPEDSGIANSAQAALSVDQPMASLILSGLRRFIGCKWRTAHRGRLWIIAADLIPTKSQITAARLFYSQMYTSLDAPSPRSFPTRRILGCVDVVRCLTQEEYRSQVLDATSPLENHTPWLWEVDTPSFVEAPTELKRSFRYHRNKLTCLPMATVDSLTPSLVPVDLSWRPLRALRPVLGRLHSASEPVEEGALDIASASLSSLSAAQTCISHSMFSKSQGTVRRLRPGMVLLKGYLSMDMQVRLLAIVRSLGRGAGGFYTPTYDTGASMHCAMMCMGQHWNPRTGAYESSRNNFDGATPPPIPTELLIVVQHAIAAAKRADTTSCGFTVDRSGAPRQQVPFNPDVCLANFYKPSSGRLGMHQDRDESAAALKAGSPVLSISIGATADFAYSKSKPKARSTEPAEHSVKLESGDILVFGGPSRMLFHGITRVHPNTAPSELPMVPGRLNLTLRQNQVRR